MFGETADAIRAAGLLLHYQKCRQVPVIDGERQDVAVGQGQQFVPHRYAAVGRQLAHKVGSGLLLLQSAAGCFGSGGYRGITVEKSGGGSWVVIRVVDFHFCTGLGREQYHEQELAEPAVRWCTMLCNHAASCLIKGN